MPTSCDHYLHEEWFVKTPSGCSNNGLKVITSFPSNLQIMPDAITDVTLKNQMQSSFMRMERAKKTSHLLHNLPMTSLKHVPHFKTIS
jgi:hypothetical protein